MKSVCCNTNAAGAQSDLLEMSIRSELTKAGFVPVEKAENPDAVLTISHSPVEPWRERGNDPLRLTATLQTADGERLWQTEISPPSPKAQKSDTARWAHRLVEKLHKAVTAAGKAK